LRQPKPRGIDIKMINMYISTDQDLRPRSFGRLERQHGLRRRRGDDFQRAGLLQLPENCQQIAFVFFNKDAASVRKHVGIEFGELAKSGMLPSPFAFSICEVDQEIEVLEVTLAKQPVL